MKIPRITWRQLLINGGVAAAIIGVCFTFFLNLFTGDKEKKNNSSINFNGDTEVNDGNFSGGNMTIYEDSDNLNSNRKRENPAKVVDPSKGKNKIKSSDQEQASNQKSVEINNSNFANTIIYNSGNQKELIEFYKYQAEEIRTKLFTLYCFAPIRDFLIEFEELHKKHILHLKKGNPILAAKYVEKIHRLSAELEFKEDQLEKEYKEKYEDSLGLIGNRIHYHKSWEPKAIYGDLANKYMTGEFTPYSVQSFELFIPERALQYMDSSVYRQNLLKSYEALSKRNLER
jgi:hypothetical protein